MSPVYATFTDRWAVSANEDSDENTHFNNPGAGLQAEYEIRWGDLLNGVTSGLTLTTQSPTSSDLTMGAGRAILAGKRYLGPATVDFTGKAAGDYFAYLTAADDAIPFKVKTATPTSAELIIGTLTWDGANFDAAGPDEGRKVKGIQAGLYQFGWDGTLNTSMEFPIPVRDNSWIESVDFILKDNGSVSGGVTVDILLGADGSAGTTIYTTAARRPTITTSTADYTIATGGEPDGDRNPDAGEHLLAKVVAVDGGGTASTLTGTIRWRHR